jgi:NAD(P)-dependent dehydrogenase (short-subunit alcohol dehydrogenase family)
VQEAEPSRFGWASTADEVLADVDLAGRVAVVTGASGGIGAESARALAARGATVVLGARDVAKAGKVADAIRAAGVGTAEVAALELGSFASVRAFAERVLARHPRIDLLLNNAGVMACPFGRTEAGHELQLGTNHVGHFLLTARLAPALRAAGAARVVNTSSAGHRFSPVVFDDPHYLRRPYDKWEAYGQSKTANVLFAVELDRRLGAAGVRAFAVHPGMIVTELGRHLDADDIAQLRARARSASGGGSGGASQWKSVPQGAATQCWGATAPELAGRGGLYLEDCHVAGMSDDPSARGGVLGWALDPEAAARLWALSEEWVGERFAAD